jgi:hypothetical protein
MGRTGLRFALRKARLGRWVVLGEVVGQHCQQLSCVGGASQLKALELRRLSWPLCRRLQVKMAPQALVITVRRAAHPAPSFGHAGAPFRPLDVPPGGPDSRIQGGSIRLFRVAGIDVFLHWSWFFFAVLRLQSYDSDDSFGFAHYDLQVWYAVEYLALFGIVLLHEFGHALACRSVGGIASRIVLWPLGGLAFVDPPPRPVYWRGGKPGA